MKERPPGWQPVCVLLFKYLQRRRIGELSVKRARPKKQSFELNSEVDVLFFIYRVAELANSSQNEQ